MKAPTLRCGIPMALAIAALNSSAVLGADGDIDRAFAAINFTGTGSLQPTPVAALAVTPSGTVYTAGATTTIGAAAIPAANLFAANGVRSTAFNLESFFRKLSFSDVALGTDGTVLTTHPRYLLRKFNTAGKEVTSFLGYRDFNIVYDYDYPPDAQPTEIRVKVAADGRIYLFGRFIIQDDDGGLRRGLVRLLPSGQLDPGFTLRLDPSASSPHFNDIAITSEGEVWFVAAEDVSFLINEAGDTESYGFGKLDVSGQPLMGRSIASPATAVAVLPHGHALIAYSDPGSAYIRQVDQDGNDVESWQEAGLAPAADNLIPSFSTRSEDVDALDPRITVMVTQADGKVIVGGDFEAGTEMLGLTRNNIVRLNWKGEFDPTFVARTGSLGSVTDMQLQADGKVVIGGSFDKINGETRKALVKLLNNTGAGWGTVGGPVAKDGPAGATSGGKLLSSLQFLPGWYYCTSFAFKDGFAFNSDRCFLRFSVGQDSARVEEMIVSSFDEELTDPKVLELGTGATYSPDQAGLEQSALEISKGKITSFPTLVWGPGTVLRTTVFGSDIIAFNAEGPLVAFTSGLAGTFPDEPAAAVVPGGYYKRIPGTSTAVGSNVGQMYSGFYPGTPYPYAGSPRILQFVTQKTNGVSFYMGLFHIQTPGTGLTLTRDDIPSPDKTAPVIALRYPAANTKYASEAATIAGSVTELGWIDSVEWRLNGGEWQPAYGRQRWTAQVKPLIPGTNQVEVRCVDGAGNMSRPVTPLKIIRL